MANDPVYDYLLNRVLGLETALTALMQHLIQKDVTDKESLIFWLAAMGEMLALHPDQKEVLDSLIRN